MIRGRKRKADDARIAALYRSGLTMPQVAAETGVCARTVLNALRRSGTPSRPQGPPRASEISERDQAIVAAYRSGLTMPQVGAAFGISNQRVHQVIVRYEAITGERVEPPLWRPKRGIGYEGAAA